MKTGDVIKNRWAVLFAVFFVAVSMRIGGNLIREKAFFHKPLLLSGDAYVRGFGCDSMWYDGTAKAFLKGKGLTSVDLNWANDRQLLGRCAWVDYKQIDEIYYAHKAVPPLYPLFLALCYYIFGINTLSYFIPQIILSSLTCVFVYLLAEEIFSAPRVALTAALAAAVYPELIFWTYQIRTETLFIFLLVLGFLFLAAGSARRRPLLVLAGGVPLGLAALTKGVLIPFIPILFLWQIISSKNGGRNMIMAGLAMIAVIFLILLPWCVRNLLVFDKFTPFCDEVYAFLFPVGPYTEEAANAICRINGSLISRAAAFIARDPGAYISSYWERFVMFWSPYTIHMKNIAKLCKTLTWLAVFPLAFFGIALSRRLWRRSGLIIIFIFYYALIHSASCMDTGLVYRYPVLPFLCIFAAYGFWTIYEKVKTGRI